MASSGAGSFSAQQETPSLSCFCFEAEAALPPPGESGGSRHQVFKVFAALDDASVMHRLDGPQLPILGREPLTLRWRTASPSGSGTGSWSGKVPLLFGALSSGLWVMRFRGDGRLVVLGLSALSLIICLYANSQAHRRTSLSLLDDRLIYRRLFGTRTISLPTSRRLRFVELTVDLGKSTEVRASKRWILLDSDDSVILRLIVSTWGEEQLQALRSRLQVPLSVKDGVYTAKQARAEYPGSVSAWVGRFYVFVMVVTVLIGVVWSILAGPPPEG